MPDHIRKQVRDAAVADLTGLATTGANVFTARVASLTSAEMPGLVVMLRAETSQHDTMSPGPTIARDGRLVVEGRAQGGDGLEDTLDQIAVEVETQIYTTAEALDLLLMNIGTPTTEIELLEPSEGVAQRTGVIRMLFPVTYRTPLADPTTRV